MKSILFLFITLLNIILFSCGLHKSSDTTSDDFFYEGTDKESYLRGRSLVVTECAGCHRFYSTDEYTPEQWEKIIKRKKQRLTFSENQEKDIIHYFKVERSKKRLSETFNE